VSLNETVNSAENFAPTKPYNFPTKQKFNLYLSIKQRWCNTCWRGGSRL